MANTFRLKRSGVQGKQPTTSDLQLGEVALNTRDGKLYTTRNDGTTDYVIRLDNIRSWEPDYAYKVGDIITANVSGAWLLYRANTDHTSTGTSFPGGQAVGTEWGQVAGSGSGGGGGGATVINDLTDVDTSTTAPQVDEFLKWNGTAWVPDEALQPGDNVSGLVNDAGYVTTGNVGGGKGINVNPGQGGGGNPNLTVELDHETVAWVASIKDLCDPAQAAVLQDAGVVYVQQYFEDYSDPELIGTGRTASKGGGLFVWEAPRYRSVHDGGTFISPSAIFDGTWSGLSDFLDGNGDPYRYDTAQVGCWRRQWEGELQAAFFGCVGNGIADDSIAIQAALNTANQIQRGTYNWDTTGHYNKVQIRGHCRIKKYLHVPERIVLFGDVNTHAYTDQNVAFRWDTNWINTPTIVVDPTCQLWSNNSISDERAAVVLAANAAGLEGCVVDGYELPSGSRYSSIYGFDTYGQLVENGEFEFIVIDPDDNREYYGNLAITTQDLPGAYLDDHYYPGFQFKAQGGNRTGIPTWGGAASNPNVTEANPYYWWCSPLPAGWSLSPSGFLTFDDDNYDLTPGTTDVWVNVVDAQNTVITKLFKLEVKGLMIYPHKEGVLPATVGTPYSFQLGRVLNNDGSGHYWWLFNKPAGMSINQSTGVFSGTPAGETAGNYKMQLLLTTSNDANTWHNNTIIDRFEIDFLVTTGGEWPELYVQDPPEKPLYGEYFEMQLFAYNAPGPYTFNVVAGLQNTNYPNQVPGYPTATGPAPGLTLSSSGLLSGIYLNEDEGQQQINFYVNIVSANGRSQIHWVTLGGRRYPEPPVIKFAKYYTAPVAVKGQPYSWQVEDRSSYLYFNPYQDPTNQVAAFTFNYLSGQSGELTVTPSTHRVLSRFVLAAQAGDQMRGKDGFVYAKNTITLTGSFVDNGNGTYTAPATSDQSDPGQGYVNLDFGWVRMIVAGLNPVTYTPNAPQPERWGYYTAPLNNFPTGIDIDANGLISGTPTGYYKANGIATQWGTYIRDVHSRNFKNGAAIICVGPSNCQRFTNIHAAGSDVGISLQHWYDSRLQTFMIMGCRIGVASTGGVSANTITDGRIEYCHEYGWFGSQAPHQIFNHIYFDTIGYAAMYLTDCSHTTVTGSHFYRTGRRQLWRGKHYKPTADPKWSTHIRLEDSYSCTFSGNVFTTGGGDDNTAEANLVSYLGYNNWGQVISPVCCVWLSKCDDMIIDSNNLTGSTDQAVVTDVYGPSTVEMTGNTVKEKGTLSGLVSPSDPLTLKNIFRDPRWDNWECPTELTFDPYYSSDLPNFNEQTNFLCHCEDFTDSSVIGMYIQNNGAEASTVRQKFGAKSWYFNGVNAHAHVDHHGGSGDSEFGFHFGEYTMEFWFNAQTIDQQQTMFSYNGTWQSGTLFDVCISPDSHIEIKSNRDGGNPTGLVRWRSTFTINQDQWYHIVLNRTGGYSSNKLWIYINGEVADNANNGSFPYIDQSDTSNAFTQLWNPRPVFGQAGFNGENFHGYLDEIRITKGIARYKNLTTFPLATSAYADFEAEVPTYGDSKILLPPVPGAADIRHHIGNNETLGIDAMKQTSVTVWLGSQSQEPVTITRYNSNDEVSEQIASGTTLPFYQGIEQPGDQFLRVQRTAPPSGSGYQLFELHFHYVQQADWRMFNKLRGKRMACTFWARCGENQTNNTASIGLLNTMYAGSPSWLSYDLSLNQLTFSSYWQRFYFEFDFEYFYEIPVERTGAIAFIRLAMTDMTVDWDVYIGGFMVHTAPPNYGLTNYTEDRYLTLS